jgi:hypothetical protein
LDCQPTKADVKFEVAEIICVRCERIFGTERSLRRHREAGGNCSKRSDSLVCAECGKIFETKAKRKTHMYCVHGATLRCEECGLTYLRIRTRRHLLSPQHRGAVRRPIRLPFVEASPSVQQKRMQEAVAVFTSALAARGAEARRRCWDLAAARHPELGGRRAAMEPLTGDQLGELGRRARLGHTQLAGLVAVLRGKWGHSVVDGEIDQANGLSL